MGEVSEVIRRTFIFSVAVPIRFIKLCSVISVSG